MEVWSLEISLGHFAADITLLSLLLIIGTMLRRYVPLFQKFLMPNNIIAGFVGLLAVSVITEFYPSDYFTGMSDRMGAYVYHLLALTMISVSLTQRRTSLGKAPVLMGMMFVFIYMIQGIIGMGVTFGLIYTIMPDLFPGFGMLMPLGFGMGPGISFSIARSWEAFGFTDGGVTGLSIAVAGLLIVYIPGIYILRNFIRKGEATFIKGEVDLDEQIEKGILSPSGRLPSAGKLTTSTEAIDAATLHFAFIGLVYGITMVVCKGLEYFLIDIGAAGEVNTLWSFHFIIGTVLALLVRYIIDRANIGHLIDSDLMTRNANQFVDFMITTSIVAISFSVVLAYIIPIALTTLIVPIVSYLVIKKAVYHWFDDYKFERFIAIFGDMVGTIQSALVLLRVLDPKFKSSVSLDLVYGSGVALIVGFPLLILINAPVNFFENILVGYWSVTLVMALYMLLLLGAMHLYMGRGKE